MLAMKGSIYSTRRQVATSKQWTKPAASGRQRQTTFFPIPLTLTPIGPVISLRDPHSKELCAKLALFSRFNPLFLCVYVCVRKWSIEILYCTGSTIHQSCKQLHTLADGFGDSWTISRTVESIDSLRRSMAEAQHHGIITLHYILGVLILSPPRSNIKLDDLR